MGENAVARLKGEGTNIGKTDMPTVPVSDIYFPPQSGHPLSQVWHPRSVLTGDDPGIARLVEEIVEAGEITKPGLVREDWIRGTPVDGDGFTWKTDAIGPKRKVFTCIDCAGRKIAGMIAEERLHAEGKLHRNGQPIPLRIKIRIWAGSDKDLLIQRQREQQDPSKRPHLMSDLAVMTGQMLAAECTMSDILSVMPRDVGKAEIEAMQRWGNLHPDAAKAFDDGAPIGLLSSVLDVPRDEQFAHLVSLWDKGLKTKKGATRAANVQRKARGETVPQRRMHPKTAAKIIEACDVLTPESEAENEPPLTDDLLSRRAEGFVFGMALANGLTTVDDLPTELREVVMRVLAKAKPAQVAA